MEGVGGKTGQIRRANDGARDNSDDVGERKKNGTEFGAAETLTRKDGGDQYLVTIGAGV